MSWSLIFDNLITYSLQIGMLVAAASVIPTVLRLRQPGAKLIYWQILLAACLLLPLQPWRQAVTTGTVRITSEVATVRTLPSAPSTHSIPRGEIVLLVVLAGVAIRLGWLGGGFWKLHRYRRHSQPLDPAPSWSVEASLMVCDDIASPVTFGWRKPVVLLPANFPELSPALRDAILCHEIMHVRRGDWLFTVAEELVRSVFWFHPAIWWLLGEIGLAREQEVDRLAIEITREREQYMDALLAIAGAGTQLDLAPAPLFLRKRHLRHRVILIVQEARVSKARLISTLTTGLATLAAACWLVTGAFPLTAEPQVVNDAAGVTVYLNGSQVLHRTSVRYPAGALKDGVQGMVSVEVKLDSTGNVSDAHVLSGPDELRSAVLQSVLDWHFTRDAANATRDVQVAFELPQAGVVQGVASGAPGGIADGVPGGVPQGVPGGVSGGVPGGIRANTVRQSITVTASPLPARSVRIGKIQAAGLSDEASSQLLATIPVHEGEELTTENRQQIVRAAKAFDEHLAVMISDSGAGDGTANVTILAPGAQNAPPPPPVPSAASLQNPPSKITVGGNVQSAMILRKVAPAYPLLAKSAHVEGTVRLAVVINKDGLVQEMHLLDGPALLVQAAMDAVKQWVYRPTLLNGEPVNVQTTVDINFTLEK